MHLFLVHIIEPGTGELASGLTGKGRMAEPERIRQELSAWFKKQAPLLGFRALITSGPTREPIDAVRFIGNRSSGRQGAAIAVKDVVWRCSWPAASVVSAVTAVVVDACMQTPK